MSVISDDVRDQVKDMFKELKENVKLVVFTQEKDCPYCNTNGELMKEITSLSDKIKLEIFDLVKDKEKSKQYNIDKAPATIVKGKKNCKIKFYGIPAGYEFMSILHAIAIVSAGESELVPETKTQLNNIKKPVHIQVFVTPSCPHCPPAVQIAHKMAMENDLITADMIEAEEFPELSEKYGVYSVPKVVINENIQFEGSLPEEEFLKQVMKSQ